MGTFAYAQRGTSFMGGVHDHTGRSALMLPPVELAIFFGIDRTTSRLEVLFTLDGEGICEFVTLSWNEPCGELLRVDSDVQGAERGILIFAGPG